MSDTLRIIRVLDEVSRLRKIERAAKELTDWHDGLHAEGDPFTSPDAFVVGKVTQCVECGQYWPCDLEKLRRALTEDTP